jgi:hypothetical protein
MLQVSFAEGLPIIEYAGIAVKGSTMRLKASSPFHFMMQGATKYMGCIAAELAQ